MCVLICGALMLLVHCYESRRVGKKPAAKSQGFPFSQTRIMNYK